VSSFDQVEVAAINPVASIMAIENQNLPEIAGEIKGKLERVPEDGRLSSSLEEITYLPEPFFHSCSFVCSEFFSNS
jgi:hypothetical protein